MFPIEPDVTEPSPKPYFLYTLSHFISNNPEKYGFPFLVGGTEELKAILPFVQFSQKQPYVTFLISAFNHRMVLHLHNTKEGIKGFLFDSQGFGIRFYPITEISKALHAKFSDKLTLWISHTPWQAQSLQVGCTALCLEILHYIQNNAEKLIAEIQKLPWIISKESKSGRMFPTNVHLLKEGSMPSSLKDFLSEQIKSYLPNLSDPWKHEKTLKDEVLEKFSEIYDAILKNYTIQPNVEQFNWLRRIEPKHHLLPITDTPQYHFQIISPGVMTLTFTDQDSMYFGNALLWAPTVLYPAQIKNNPKLLQSAFLGTETVTVSLNLTQRTLTFTAQDKSNTTLSSYFDQIRLPKNLNKRNEYLQPLALEIAAAEALEVLEIVSCQKYGLALDMVSSTLQYELREHEDIQVIVHLRNHCDLPKVMDTIMAAAFEGRRSVLSFPINEEHQIAIIIDPEQRTITGWDSQNTTYENDLSLIFSSTFPEYRCILATPYSIQQDDWSCGVHVILNILCALQIIPSESLPANILGWTRRILRLNQNIKSVEARSELFSDREKTICGILEQIFVSSKSIYSETLIKTLNAVPKEIKYPLEYLTTSYRNSHSIATDNHYTSSILSLLRIGLVLTHLPESDNAEFLREFLSFLKISLPCPKEKFWSTPHQKARDILDTALNLEFKNGSFPNPEISKYYAYHLLHSLLKKRENVEFFCQFLKTEFSYYEKATYEILADDNTGKSIILFHSFSLVSEYILHQEQTILDFQKSLQAQEKQNKKLLEIKKNLSQEILINIKKFLPEPIHEIEVFYHKDVLELLSQQPLHYLRSFSPEKWADLITQYRKILFNPPKTLIEKHLSLRALSQGKEQSDELMAIAFSSFAWNIDQLTRVINYFPGEYHEIISSEKITMIKKITDLEKIFSVTNSFEAELMLHAIYEEKFREISDQDCAMEPTRFKDNEINSIDRLIKTLKKCRSKEQKVVLSSKMHLITDWLSLIRTLLVIKSWKLKTQIAKCNLDKITHPLQLTMMIYAVSETSRKYFIEVKKNLITHGSILWLLVRSLEHSAAAADNLVLTHLFRINTCIELFNLIGLHILSHDAEAFLLKQKIHLAKELSDVLELAELIRFDDLQTQLVLSHTNQIDHIFLLKQALSCLNQTAQKELMRLKTHLISNFSDLSIIISTLSCSIREEFLENHLCKIETYDQLLWIIHNVEIKKSQSAIIALSASWKWTWKMVEQYISFLKDRSLIDEFILNKSQVITNIFDLTRALKLLSEDLEITLLSQKKFLIERWGDVNLVLRYCYSQNARDILILENSHRVENIFDLETAIMLLSKNLKEKFLQKKINLIQNWNNLSRILTALKHPEVLVRFIIKNHHLIQNNSDLKQALRYMSPEEKEIFLNFIPLPINDWKDAYSIASVLAKGIFKERFVLKHIYKAQNLIELRQAIFLLSDDTKKQFLCHKDFLALGNNLVETFKDLKNLLQISTIEDFHRNVIENTHVICFEKDLKEFLTLSIPSEILRIISETKFKFEFYTVEGLAQVAQQLPMNFRSAFFIKNSESVRNITDLMEILTLVQDCHKIEIALKFKHLIGSEADFQKIIFKLSPSEEKEKFCAAHNTDLNGVPFSSLWHPLPPHESKGLPTPCNPIHPRTSR